MGLTRGDCPPSSREAGEVTNGFGIFVAVDNEDQESIEFIGIFHSDPTLDVSRCIDHIDNSWILT